MKKRIICLILICVLSLQFVALNTGVMAEETVTTVTENSELTMFKNLGVIDKTVSGSDAVTREALAKVIVNIVYGGIPPKDKNATEFYTDITAEQASHVNTVTRLKVMNGVGDGCFSPDANVTYMQALKVIVAFMGYSVKADAFGGYPGGYLSVATELKLTKGISANLEDFITYDSLSWVLKNASVANIAYTINSGNGSVNLEEAGSFLSYHMHVNYDEGAVKINYIGSTDNASQEIYNVININGEKYCLTTNTMDLRNHLGEWAQIYYKSENGYNYIMHYVINPKKIVHITSEQVGKLTNGKLFYFDDNGKEKKIGFDPEKVSILYNNSALSNYTDDFLYNTFEVKDGSVSCIDDDGDGVYDVINIEAYETHIANKVVDDKIYTKHKTEKVLDFDDIENNVAIVNALGEPIKFTDISVGDTLCVEKDVYGRINTITVLMDKISTTIAGMSFDSNGMIDSLTVTNMEYPISNGLKNLMSTYPDEYNVVIGKKIVAYFNKDLEIAEILTSEFESYNTAYLVAHGINKGMDPTHSIKVFTANGEMEVYTLEDNLRMGYTRTPISADDFVDLLYSGNEKVVRQIILFTVNERSGKIDWVDICNGKTDEDNEDGLYKYMVFENAVRDNIQIDYTESNLTFCGLLLISEGTTIFVVPSEEERDSDAGYTIEYERNLKNNRIIIPSTDSSTGTVNEKWEAYGTQKGNPCAEVLVWEKNVVAEISDNISASVVKDVSVILDDNRNIVSTITVLSGDAEKKYITDDGLANFGSMSGRKVDKGDVIRFTSNSANEIIMLQLLYDCSEDEISTAPLVNDSTKGYRDGLRMIKGNVSRSGSTFYEVEYADAATGVLHKEFRPYVFVHPVYGVTLGRDNAVTDVVKLADYDIYSEEDYPGMASKIFLQCNNGYLIFAVIYN